MVDKKWLLYDDRKRKNNGCHQINQRANQLLNVAVRKVLQTVNSNLYCEQLPVNINSSMKKKSYFT